MQTEEIAEGVAAEEAPAPKKKGGKLSKLSPKIAEAQTLPVNEEQFERAKGIGKKMIGTNEATALFAMDTFKMVATDSVDGLLDVLESVAVDVETFTVGDRKYVLTNLLKIKPAQFRPAWRLLNELLAEVNIGGVSDIANIFDMLMTDERVDELLSVLYVREGVRFTIEDATTARPDIGELELGQRAGAIWRFFTSVVPFAVDTTRAFLARLATINLMKFGES